MTERDCLICLNTFPQFGPKRLNLLIPFFGSAREVWSASDTNLLKTGLSENIVNSFLSYRQNFKATDYFKKLENLKVKAVCVNDEDYPSNLREIDYAPQVLYIKGTFSRKDERAIAVVGSRKMSRYGLETTEQFVTAFASLGITVISGLARGIDTVAHRETLNYKGRTIAVCGSGLDRVYPPENYGLAERICQNGCLVSEFMPGHAITPYNFISRNRIISGMAKAVLVIEGEGKSGTLITASYAAEQGREVFAVPGPINSPVSKAPLFLIKNGAKMVTGIEEILEELNF